MNQTTQNYLVIGVVVLALAVIIPIYFRPLFSSSEPPQKPSGPSRSFTRGEGRPPHPNMGGPANFPRDFPMPGGAGRPHMGTPHNTHAEPAAADKGRGGIMSIALPIYSIGIVLYVLYVFYKFYTKGFTPAADSTPRRPGGAKVANAKPTAEQIQNYKQFLMAKEECAKRIEEEKANGTNQLDATQLSQLEERLKEAEDAMEKAMEKMGLNIADIKRETNYRDPLAESLKELRMTMDRLSSSGGVADQPKQHTVKVHFDDDALPTKGDSDPVKPKEPDVDPENSGEDSDSMQPPPPAHNQRRRVSFADSATTIDQSELSIPGEVGDDHAEDKQHPPTEPEGKYLKSDVVEDIGPNKSESVEDNTDEPEKTTDESPVESETQES